MVGGLEQPLQFGLRRQNFCLCQLALGDVANIALGHPGVTYQIDIADELHMYRLSLRSFQWEVFITHIILLLQFQKFILVCHNIFQETQIPDVLPEALFMRVTQ